MHAGDEHAAHIAIEEVRAVVDGWPADETLSPGRQAWLEGLRRVERVIGPARPH